MFDTYLGTLMTQNDKCCGVCYVEKRTGLGFWDSFPHTYMYPDAASGVALLHAYFIPITEYLTPEFEATRGHHVCLFHLQLFVTQFLLPFQGHTQAFCIAT